MERQGFKIVAPHAEEVFREIRRRIWRLQSGGTMDSLREIGAETQGQIGASFVSLKELAGRYEPDEEVALMLWGTGRREEQIVACMLLPEEMNKEKITQLLHLCLNWEVAGYFGSLYLYKHAGIAEIGKEWLLSGVAALQVAALQGLARHLLVYKEHSRITKECFREAVNREYEERYVQMTAERYRFNL